MLRWDASNDSHPTLGMTAPGAPHPAAPRAERRRVAAGAWIGLGVVGILFVMSAHSRLRTGERPAAAAAISSAEQDDGRLDADAAQAAQLRALDGSCAGELLQALSSAVGMTVFEDRMSATQGGRCSSAENAEPTGGMSLTERHVPRAARTACSQVVRQESSLAQMRPRLRR
jgi:hypothetical protein